MQPLGMATPAQIRELINRVWIGDPQDEHARFVLADALDEIGRRDCAMLWRDELPGYRRRQRITKLDNAERDQFVTNLRWCNEHVVHRIGETDELLALAAIGALYRASNQRRAETLPLPRVVWAPTPIVVREWILHTSTPGEIWYQHVGVTSANRQVPFALQREINDFVYEIVRSGPYEFTNAAAEQLNNANLGHGLSNGQFYVERSKWIAALDILRLEIGVNNERSLRAGNALAQCSPYWIAFENTIYLSRHPTVFTPRGGMYQPLWAWIDDNNTGHQWPE